MLDGIKNVFKVSAPEENKAPVVTPVVETPQTNGHSNGIHKVEDEYTWFRHYGKSGFLAYDSGKTKMIQVGNEMVLQPIPKIIYFENHLYKTKDPVEIAEIDAVIASTNRKDVVRHDAFLSEKAFAPKRIPMEVDGQKFYVDTAKVQEWAKEHLQKNKQN